jgi:hypothetical protein
MRLGYSLQHIEEQPNALSDAKPVLVTVAVNVVALNVLENKKRLAGE